MFCKHNYNMALAINIEDLLNKQKIESNRIEFKKGWNPASIYHSVCAFTYWFGEQASGQASDQAMVHAMVQATQVKRLVKVM